MGVNCTLTLTTLLSDRDRMARTLLGLASLALLSTGFAEYQELLNQYATPLSFLTSCAEIAQSAPTFICQCVCVCLVGWWLSVGRLFRTVVGVAVGQTFSSFNHQPHLAHFFRRSLRYGSQFSVASQGQYGDSSAQCAPPILNQEQCGGCYAFSTATVLGSSACVQSVSSATSAAVNLSPQFTLGVKFAQPESQGCTSLTGCAHPNPCQGGWPLELMYDTAEYCGNNPNGCWMTCGGTSCDAGCMPFNEGECTTSASEIPAGSSIDSCHNCDGCNDFALPSSQPCSNPALTGPTSLPLGVPLYRTVPDLNQGDSSMDAIISSAHAALDMGAGPSATTQALLKGTTIAGQTMHWLQNYGPVSVAMNACDNFMDYWEGYYPPMTTANVQGCNGAVDHAVTVVGWAVINGVPCWTIQNSWGGPNSAQPGPDGGFFHVPFDQVGYGGSSNHMTIAFPTGVYFSTAADTRRHRRSLEALRNRAATASPIDVLGRESAVSDPAKLATLPAYAAAALSEKHGEAMSVTEVHTVTRQVTANATYRVYATVAPVRNLGQKTMVAVALARQNNHSYAYLQHEVIQSPETAPSLQGDAPASTQSSGSTVRIAVGVGAAVLVVLIIAAYVVSNNRRTARQASAYAAVNALDDMEEQY